MAAASAASSVLGVGFSILSDSLVGSGGFFVAAAGLAVGLAVGGSASAAGAGPLGLEGFDELSVSASAS